MQPHLIRYQEENLISAQLYDLLALSIYIDEKMFNQALQILRKKKLSQNCYQFLCSIEFEQHYSDLQEQYKPDCLISNIQKLTQLIKNVMDHDFNSINYSSKMYQGERKQLIKKLSTIDKIAEFLKFLVKLSAIDEKMIQSSSNSLCLLVEMGIDLTQQCWQNIKIKNTSLIGANFAKSILSGSEFENVQIDGINLNGAILFNCKWKDLILSEFYQFNGYYDKTNKVCFSPDGILLASTNKDGLVLIWNFKTGKLKSILKQKGDDVNQLCLSPDNITLACESKKGKIRIWNFRQGKIKQILKGHNLDVNCVCFSLNGTMLVSGSEWGIINLWDVKIGALIQSFDTSGGINSVSLSPDGSLLLAGGRESYVHFWNLKTREHKQSKIGNQNYFNNEIFCICFSHDGSLLAVSQRGSVLLLDVKTENLEFRFYNSSANSVCFSPDDDWLAFCDDRSIYLKNVKTGKEIFKSNGNQYVKSVCFSPSGTIMASCNGAKSISLWNVKEGGEKPQFGHQYVWGINSICFSPDGNILASGGRSTVISFWDAKTGKLKFQLNEQKKFISSICFSPDGTMLASAGQSSSIFLWDVKTGKLKSQLNENTDQINSVCFSPNGTLLASGNKTQSISLWM